MKMDTPVPPGFIILPIAWDDRTTNHMAVRVADIQGVCPRLHNWTHEQNDERADVVLRGREEPLVVRMGALEVLALMDPKPKCEFCMDEGVVGTAPCSACPTGPVSATQ